TARQSLPRRFVRRGSLCKESWLKQMAKGTNPLLLATPVYTLLPFLSQWPGAPEHGRSAARPLRVLVLALVVVICPGCATRTSSVGDSAWEAFPVLPPIGDVDPSIRHELQVKVPTQLIIERATDSHGKDMVMIRGDRHSLEATNITVGSNMVIGVRSE